MGRGGRPDLSDEEIAVLRVWFAGRCMAMARRLARAGRLDEAAKWAADAEMYGTGRRS